jgi:hypothetical protein
MTGTNFSSWYNASEGTLVVDADAIATNINSTTINVSYAGGGTERVQFRTDTNLAQYVYIVGGVAQATLSSGTLTSRVPFKTAGAYKVNDFALSTNGGTVVTDTSGSVASPTELKIGRLTSVSEYLNGHIRQIAYFNSRLPNAQLQALTAPPLTSPLFMNFTTGSYTVGY